MKLWMARDAVEKGQLYIVSVKKPQELLRGAWYSARPSIDFCPAFWHRLGGPRLKPGAGPVRIEVDPKLFGKAVKVVREK